MCLQKEGPNSEFEVSWLQEKMEVRSDLRNHPWQASLVACSTTNRLQVGCSGLQVPAQSGSSLPDGDGTTHVTHSRTAYALFICSQRCYRAKDRMCSVGSSRFLERWTLTLEQSSNWLESYKPSFQCIYKTAWNTLVSKSSEYYYQLLDKWGHWWLPARGAPCTCPGIHLPGKTKCHLHS